jgi:hypothetical protein
MIGTGEAGKIARNEVAVAATLEVALRDRR